MRVSIKPITVSHGKSSKNKNALPLNEQEVKKRLSRALVKTAKTATPFYEAVFSTWSNKHDKSIYETKPAVHGDNMDMSVYTQDAIFWFLDNGVPLHAKMHKDFRPKTVATKPATYKSTKGAGPRAPLWFQKQPRGYIQPRNWTQQMSEDLTPILKFYVDGELNK